jgi:hypothetical protein
MKKYLKTIWNEIREGKNIDVYLTMLVCGMLLVLDIFGVVSTSIISSGILATLLLIALSTLSSRHTNQRVEATLANIEKSADKRSALEFFSEWDGRLFKQKLATAREISLFAIANYDFITSNSEELKQFLQRGGQLRYIYVEPDGEAIKMAADRGFGVEREPQHLPMLSAMSLRRLKEVAQEAPSQDSVKIKTIDYLPSSVITMVDHQEPSGVIFVTLNGFGQPFISRPSLTLNKQKDGKWFTFYQECFENIWQWTGCKDLDLVHDLS